MDQVKRINFDKAQHCLYLSIQSLQMRIFIILIFAFNVSLNAIGQTPLAWNPGYHYQVIDSNVLRKKWSVSIYTGFIGGPGFLSPAIGLQLNRRLTNNLYAFTGVSSFNYMTTPGFNTNQWSISKSLQAGLMYVNDARTFSISGSIGVSNSNYPYRTVTQKQPMVI